MKFRKPGTREIVILIVTFILFFLLFHFWDEVKIFITGLFT